MSASDKVTPFDAYVAYLGVKTHFTSPTYDGTKYNFTVSAKERTYWKRKDKHFFGKAARKFESSRDDLIQYYVSHFVHKVNHVPWIGEIVDKESVYRDWTRKQESLTYLTQSDIRTLYDRVDGKFDELFSLSGGTYPPVIQSYMEQEISIETLAIIERLLHYTTNLHQQVADPILWPKLRLLIRKYEPLIRFDEESIRQFLLSEFSE